MGKNKRPNDNLPPDNNKRPPLFIHLINLIDKNKNDENKDDEDKSSCDGNFFSSYIVIFLLFLLLSKKIDFLIF
jgi:hypothetical protein